MLKGDGGCGDDEDCKDIGHEDGKGGSKISGDHGKDDNDGMVGMLAKVVVMVMVMVRVVLKVVRMVDVG